MKHVKGLTLMELTIVLAIIAIIAGVLIPLYLLTTDRARLRGDIQSARVIQNAIDLYVIERGSTDIMNGNDVTAIVARLADMRYINSRNTKIQTTGATWVRFNHPDHGRMVVVDIGGTTVPDEVHRAFASLPDDEKIYVRNGDLTR